LVQRLLGVDGIAVDGGCRGEEGREKVVQGGRESGGECDACKVGGIRIIRTVPTRRGNVGHYVAKDGIEVHGAARASSYVAM